jgi:hypothetical protein
MSCKEALGCKLRLLSLQIYSNLPSVQGTSSYQYLTSEEQGSMSVARNYKMESFHKRQMPVIKLFKNSFGILK